MVEQSSETGLNFHISKSSKSVFISNAESHKENNEWFELKLKAELFARANSDSSQRHLIAICDSL